MAYAEIIEEAKTLSEYSASEVLYFIKFLKAKESKKSNERKSNLLAGGLIFMSEDFDETPDCFNRISKNIKKEASLYNT